MAAVAIRVGSQGALAPAGFAATYFANADFAAPAERSLEYSGTDATRVDSRLAFGGDGLPDLPLYFFNDLQRFNFYQQGQPHRSTLPFSVVWDGYVWEPDGDRARTFYLRAAGGRAELEIDGAMMLRLDPDVPDVSRTLFYPKGWRHIVVRLSVPNGGARRFEAGFRDPAGGRDRALGDSGVYRRPLSADRLTLDRIANRGRLAANGLLALWAAASAAVGLTRACRTIWSGQTIGRLTPRVAAIVLASTAMLVEAILFARPAWDRVLLQPGGDDSLAYESQARDIVLNGPLMLMGARAGEAEAFYYQPLYGYAIAASHWVFGEDLFGLLLLQRLGLWITLLAIWLTTERLFGRRAGNASILVGALFLYGVMEPWARTLWSETVFVPLAASFSYLLVALSNRQSGFGTAAVAGIVGGLAVLSRSTLLPALSLVLPLTLASRYRQQVSWWPVALMIVVMTSVVSAATWRNWIASGTFVPITTSLAVNLYLGNPPPPEVPVHRVEQHRGYGWFARDDRARMAIEFARHAPREFLAGLGRKALYVLGVSEPLVAGAGYWSALIATWLTALTGLCIALCRRATIEVPTATQLLPAALGLSIAVVVVAIFPTHPRLILPIYVLMLPYAAVAAAAALDHLSRLRG